MTGPDGVRKISAFNFGGAIASRFQLIFQFVIFPVLIVAACVAVFLIFGLISYEPKSLSDYLLDMRSGGQSRRWHAAFELSKRLARQDAADEIAGGPGSPTPPDADASFVRSLLDLYAKSKHDDPRLRQYLVLCLGYVQGAGVQEALSEALSDADPLVRLHGVWAMAIRRDTGVTPRLIEMLRQEQDAALRKALVYALGALRDSRALDVLKLHLNDAQPDIQWNTALALARMGDSSGLAVLMNMLDRQYLDQIAQMNELQKEQTMINAIRAYALLKDTQLRRKIQDIAAADKNLKVRQAAIQALKETH